MAYLYKIIIYPIELMIEVFFDMAMRVLCSPGPAIVGVSLMVNLLILPLYKRSDEMQEEERRNRQRIEPWVKHIRKAFHGDERIMMMNTLYYEQGYSPLQVLRGSLSLLLQIPFFIAAYHFLSNVEILQEASFLFLTDLGQEDQLIRLFGHSINLMPIVMTLINIVSGVIYTKGSPLKDKIQLYAVAAVFLVFLYHSPSGLVLYWTLNNLFSLVKNIFMKLIPNPSKVFCYVLSIGGLVIFIVLLIIGKLYTVKRFVFMFIILIVLQIPLLIMKITGRKEKKKKTEEIIHSPFKGNYFLWAAVLVMLVGLLIPTAVLRSSPEEFFDFENNKMPLRFAASTLCIAIGYFLVWGGVLYSMCEERVKGVIEFIITSLVCIASTDYLLFGKNLGNLSSMLVFDNDIFYSNMEIIINILIIAVITGVIIYLYLYRQNLLKPLGIVLLLSYTAIFMVNAVNTNLIIRSLDYSAYETKKPVDEQKVIKLSRQGRNVMVIMLDRFISGYIPYIFEEAPQLNKQFAGFTYYPNTTSFGHTTLVGAPSLFGGYEYTPDGMAERSNELLKDKHDEALKMMPKLFSKEGFEVTVCDPPYAGYQWNPDLSIYDDLPGVDAWALAGNYDNMSSMTNKEEADTMQERSFFLYGIMRIMPVCLQKIVYDDGLYYSVNTDWLSVRKDAFIENYSVLISLTGLTDIEEEGADQLLLFANCSTHEPYLLDEPDYTNLSKVNDESWKEEIKDDGKGNRLTFSTSDQAKHYDVDIAALLRLGEWFDYLRENDVYDNTRIIIVSDHGRDLNQFDYMHLDEGLNVERTNALLMYKDFNDKELSESDEFMTLADVPTIAVSGITNAPNPYTGKIINSNEKNSHDQTIIIEGPWQLEDAENKTEFPVTSEYDVHKNIFKRENWKKKEIPK